VPCYFARMYGKRQGYVMVTFDPNRIYRHPFKSFLIVRCCYSFQPSPESGSRTCKFIEYSVGGKKMMRGVCAMYDSVKGHSKAKRLSVVMKSMQENLFKAFQIELARQQKVGARVHVVESVREFFC